MRCLHVYKRLLPEVPGRVWRRRGPASPVPRIPGAEGADLALEFGEHPPDGRLRDFVDARDFFRRVPA